MNLLLTDSKFRSNQDEFFMSLLFDMEGNDKTIRPIVIQITMAREILPPDVSDNQVIDYAYRSISAEIENELDSSFFASDVYFGFEYNLLNRPVVDLANGHIKEIVVPRIKIKDR